MKTHVIVKRDFLHSYFLNNICRGDLAEAVRGRCARRAGALQKMWSLVDASRVGETSGWQRWNCEDAGASEYRIGAAGVCSGVLGEARCHADA